jgi:hypothetical protein
MDEKVVEFKLLHPIRKKKTVAAKKMSFDPNVIKYVPLRQRHTIRDLANALYMPKSTLHKRLKEGKFRCHTNAINLISGGTSDFD